MNPRLSRHVFADTPANVLRDLREACVFTAENGEICVPLQPCWPELLADCGDLGPVAVVSQSSLAQFAACLPWVDFAPVPGTSELVELGSNFGADTALWSHVLAVEEHVPDGRLFSLQFFAQDGSGIWKLLLTHDTPLDQFASMVRHYASGNPPPPTLPPPATPVTPRLIELQLLGCTRAQEASCDMLASLLCDARRENRAVSVEIATNGLWHHGSMIPRSLERCPRAFHAYDYGSELHLTLGEGNLLWHVQGRKGWHLELLDAGGHLAARVG